MKFSPAEKKDLWKSWIVLSVAFAILLGRGFNLENFFSNFLISGFTVGIAFLLHELGHKFLAQRYNCWAEYRAFNFMLFLALVMSFFGFILAAPGAVMIYGNMTKNKYGKISAMGPLINILLAVIFLVLYVFHIFRGITLYGFFINSFIAFFNMIPVWAFDGLKIWRWNKAVYTAMAAISLFFVVIANIFFF